MPLHFLYHSSLYHAVAFSSQLWQWSLLLLQVNHVCVHAEHDQSIVTCTESITHINYSSTAAGGTLSCNPLMNIGVILITIGACALITALCCSIYLCCIKITSDFDSSSSVHITCCLLATVMLVIFLGMAIAGTVLVAENYKTVKDGSYVDNGKFVSCNNSEVPFVLAILSWIICFLVCCCGFVSC